MKITFRDGLVLETICGTTLVIATLAARSHCPYVMQLNEASVYLWKLLAEGKDTAEIAKMAAADFQISEELAQQTIEGFVEGLIANNYAFAYKDNSED